MLLIWPLMTRVSTCGAAQILPHLLHQQLLHGVDELGALIIEDILIIEGHDFLVLGVPAGGIAGATAAARPGWGCSPRGSG